ncbi:hypothetical protein CACET_c23690 [Clostridium aceticum]|uniref:Uncharacterized protein n=1 Tax=Clostridium aceticum TaxID=84022 RepID=A0A0D8I5R7_9CLOT|nr:hypothetical protein [Clostridium aceticum]AKL95815.1 hypothetical protein CACET_c23690 [Clostridium aceticum]KJF25645.1 hypothetical protein TZ02_17230 [Clostridium aceticum]
MFRRIILALFLVVSVIILATRFLSPVDQGTTVIIKNLTNQCLENLFFGSNANGQVFSVYKIEPHSSVSFQYDIGGFNENAIYLKCVSELGDIRNYNLIGYVHELYSYIYIDIVSVDPEGNLNIKVETIK